MTMDAQRVADLTEIHELCARYMMLCSQFIDDRWLEVFTPDATPAWRSSTDPRAVDVSGATVVATQSPTITTPGNTPAS